uniref:Ankyrin-1-like n=1 Tax=Cyanistes caeruleus TaxID=156563 RepID=A0A8C0UJP5_CYACU
MEVLINLWEREQFALHGCRVKDGKGRTALHRAAEKGHGGAVQVLLRGGASMHALDMEGKTPLHWAAENNHSHILKMFLKEEAMNCRNQHNFLHMAALRDESTLAKIYAVSQGSENTAKVLLEAGATVDSNLPADIMESALFRAVQKNLHSVVAALIDRGTDINAHNKMHFTPLLLACEMGKAESAEVLIEKGANLGLRTPAADTALHLAVQAGAASIAGLLLSKGMDTNLRNRAEETPLHVAATCRCWERRRGLYQRHTAPGSPCHCCTLAAGHGSSWSHPLLGTLKKKQELY